MSDDDIGTGSGERRGRDPADAASGMRDPAFRPAMVVIGLLLVLSVAGVVHSLLATFGA